jgi:hypothetical protein
MDQEPHHRGKERTAIAYMIIVLALCVVAAAPNLAHEVRQHYFKEE